MDEFNIIPITKEHLYEISGMLPVDVSSALWKDLPVTALAVLKGNTVIGALSGAANEGYFDISSLYVAEAYRRQGAGTALMRSLFAFLDGEDLPVRVAYGIQSMKEQSLREPDELKSFLFSLGFEKVDATYPPYISEPLGNFLPDMDDTHEARRGIFTFSQVGVDLLSTLAADEVDEYGDVLHRYVAWDLLADSVDKDISLCKVKKNKIISYVAVDIAVGEPIEISAVWLSGEEAGDVSFMLSTIIANLKQEYHPKTKIILLAMGIGAWEVTKELCPDASPAAECFIRPDYGELLD